MAKPKIAVVVYTKDDPLFVSTPDIAYALRQGGFNASVVELDWASPSEWSDLHAPNPYDYGRHGRDIPVQRDYVVRVYDGPDDKTTFVRDYGGLRDRELEEIE